MGNRESLCVGRDGTQTELQAKKGSRLFFPANGYAYDQNVDTPDEGYYWTSTFSNIDNAYVTYLPSNSWGISYYDRYIGIGIRAVKMN